MDPAAELNGFSGSLRRIERSLTELHRSQAKLSTLVLDVRTVVSGNGYGSMSSNLCSDETVAATQPMATRQMSRNWSRMGSTRSRPNTPGSPVSLPVLKRDLSTNTVTPLWDTEMSPKSVIVPIGHRSSGDVASVDITPGGRRGFSPEEDSSEVGRNSPGSGGGFVASMLPAHWPKSLQLHDMYCSGYKPNASRGWTGKRLPLLSSCVTKAFQSNSNGLSTVHKPPWYIMHPDSGKQSVRDIVASLFILYELCVTPVAVAWEMETTSGWLHLLFWCSLAFWSCDIVCGFLTGYYSDGEVELRTARVARRYLRGWFFPDLLLVGCDIANIISQYFGVEGGGWLRLLRLSRLFRVVSLAKLSRFFLRVEDVLQSYENAELLSISAKLGRIVVLVLSVNHLFACLWMVIGRSASASDTSHRWIKVALWTHKGEDITFEQSTPVYQYLLCFHWALAQITLGTSNIGAYNSAEELYTILCTTFGLVMGTSLISVFSAEMVDFQLSSRQKDQVHKQLFRFLLHHRVDGGLARRVRAMVFNRLRKTPPLAEGDIKSLRLLPIYLQIELHFTICGPSLLSHPIFAIWHSFSNLTVVRFCMDAVQLNQCRPNDELFGAGKEAEKVYYLKDGLASYEQEPESAPVEDVISKEVLEDTWLAEAALWVHWTYVGTLQLTLPSEVMVIMVPGILGALQQNVVLQDVTTAYAQRFYARLIVAAPPRQAYPNDLFVPCANIEDILCSMDSNMLDAIGQQAMRATGAFDEEDPTTSVNTQRTASGAGYLEELGLGRIILFPCGLSTVRCVDLSIVLRLSKPSGGVLLHAGYMAPDGTFRVIGELPSMKQDHEESADIVCRNLIAHLLYPLQSGIEAAVQLGKLRRTLHRTEKPARQANTNVLPVMLKSVFHIDLIDDIALDSHQWVDVATILPGGHSGVQSPFRDREGSPIKSSTSRKSGGTVDGGVQTTSVHSRWLLPPTWSSAAGALLWNSNNNYYPSVDSAAGLADPQQSTSKNGWASEGPQTAIHEMNGPYIAVKHRCQADIHLFMWASAHTLPYLLSERGRSDLLMHLSSLDPGDVVRAAEGEPAGYAVEAIAEEATQEEGYDMTSALRPAAAASDADLARATAPARWKSGETYFHSL